MTRTAKGEGRRRAAREDAAASPDRNTEVRAGRRERGWALLAALLLALVGAGVYANSLDAQPVFDDVGGVVENATIRPPWDLGRVLRCEGLEATTLGSRPIGNLSLALSASLGGGGLRGHHVFNVIVHVLAGLALMGIVRRTLSLPALRETFPGRAPLALAFAIALIWTVHPLQTESVTYLVQRVESMVGLFYLLTLYCFIRGATGDHPSTWYSMALIACLLGVGTKEVIATAPLMVLLYDRLFLAGSFRQALRLRGGWHACLVATWIPLGALVAAAGGRQASAGFGLAIGPWDYAVTQALFVTRYLWLTFWPGPLVLDYGDFVAGGLWQIKPYLVFLAALLVALGVAWRRAPRLAFCGIWFFVVLAPSSSIIPVVTQTGAEHRMYLPLAGVVSLTVVAFYLFWRRIILGPAGSGGLARWAVPLTVLVVVAAALSIRSVRRNEDYLAPKVLYQHDLERWRPHLRAINNLAWAIATNERYTGEAAHAVELAERVASETEHRRLDYLDTLGAAYAAAGRFDDAVRTAKETIERARREGRQDEVVEFQKRLDLYLAGRPYRE